MLCGRAIVGGLGLWLAGCGVPADQPEVADLLLVNGAVYTMAAEGARAEALAIRGGKIVAVGSRTEIERDWRGPTRDLAGAMVLPGFHDSHVHPIAGGIQMGRCDLTDLPTPAAIQAAVGDCVTAVEPGGWVLGGGWDLSLFDQANPSKSLLDEVSGDRAVFLIGADGHSGWANSEALRRAGIEAETPDPANGIIERDARGEPSGTLRESAQNLVEGVLPEISDEERLAGARRGLALANRFGITSLIDAAVGAPELALYRQLAANDELHARVVASMSTASTPLGDAAVQLAEPRLRASRELVRPIAAKIFVDGVLEGETAALLEPYASGGVGRLETSAEDLTELVMRLDADDIQVHMHAIGDRGVRAGLDAIQRAQAANGQRDNRHHISHLQLIDPADYPRFGILGVTANMQALWAFPDEYITSINLPQVGPERVARMYPFASLQRAGARLAGGSDWFVSSINPLLAIETAVTRQDPSGNGNATLNADERLSLHTMLAAYTSNGAYLMHQEDYTGAVAPGYAADLVVLERDLFDVTPDEIGEVAVLATYFAGRLVYDAAAK